jgi:hypothetical protein
MSKHGPRCELIVQFRAGSALSLLMLAELPDRVVGEGPAMASRAQDAIYSDK